MDDTNSMLGCLENIVFFINAFFFFFFLIKKGFLYGSRTSYRDKQLGGEWRLAIETGDWWLAAKVRD